MYHFVNLMQLASVSLYFKTLVKLHNLKEGDEFTISLPLDIRKSHMLFFINVIQNAAPFLHRLILPLSVEEIFLLTDYFQIDSIFIELSDMFYADLKYGSHYLKILLEYRGISDPITMAFLDKMSKYFHTTPDKISRNLGPNFSSIHKLKNHLRSSRRFTEFHQSIQRETYCYICQETLTYRCYQPGLVKDAFLATCCGSPIHIPCISVFQLLDNCPLCTTELRGGRPNMSDQSRFQTIRRNRYREFYKIPFSHQLPSLP